VRGTRRVTCSLERGQEPEDTQGVLSVKRLRSLEGAVERSVDLVGLVHKSRRVREACLVHEVRLIGQEVAIPSVRGSDGIMGVEGLKLFLAPGLLALEGLPDLAEASADYRRVHLR